MAVQRLSPTGNLLRNSRLFSLPPPLVSPSDKVTNTRRYDSETATLPYPTQQALATTPSSLARGDWGLKRSLPLKSTARTSTPTIRIQDIDSINHITDFDSAADHVLNLKKWQEINLPISRLEKMSRIYDSKTIRPHKSVFEVEYDNIQPEISNQGRKRWKYRGPWIAGQTAGEFKEYTERNIGRRKSEFRHFLRERLERQITAADRRAAIDGGLPLPEQPPKIDEQHLDHHIKKLRQDQQGRLFELIEEFLDLPSGSKISQGEASEEAWVSPEDGPPITHPSAGLSYLRALGHTFNHPALGPQDQKQPIRARILADRDYGSNSIPTLGVGGVAVEDPRISYSGITGSGATRKRAQAKGAAAFDQEILVGTKIWVHPDQINVDSEGRIKVRTKLADPKTTALYEPGEQESQEPTPDPLANVDRRLSNLTSAKSRTTERSVNNNKISKTNNPPGESRRSNPLVDRGGFAGLLGAL